MQNQELPEVGKRIQILRQAQNLTLGELALRCGVSKSMISQIEAGKTNPTLAMIWKIARGLNQDIQALLNLSMDTAIPLEPRGKRFLHFHAESFTQLQADKPGIHFSVLTPLDQAEDLEIYVITLQPGAVLNSPPHLPGTEEYLTLLEGDLQVGTPDESAQLKAGDFILYHADGFHSMKNTGEQPAVVHLVVRFQSKKSKSRHQSGKSSPRRASRANPDQGHPKAAAFSE